MASRPTVALLTAPLLLPGCGGSESTAAPVVVVGSLLLITAAGFIAFLMRLKRRRRRVGEQTMAEAAVVLWNDDKTEMATVVEVLTSCFAMAKPEATHVMLAVHRNGSTIVGSFPMEEAQERVARALAIARSAGAPLRITVQPAASR
jgi:ATP-dependent Clp protease adaptor protein ClpS